LARLELVENIGCSFVTTMQWELEDVPMPGRWCAGVSHRFWWCARIDHLIAGGGDRGLGRAAEGVGWWL